MAGIIAAGLTSMLPGVTITANSGYKDPNFDLHAIHQYSLVTKYTEDPAVAQRKEMLEAIVNAAANSTISGSVTFKGDIQEAANSATRPVTEEIYIRMLNRKTITIAIVDFNKTTIDMLIKMVHEKEGISIDQRVLFAGKQLEGDRFLYEYGVVYKSTIHMIPRCRGGSSSSRRSIRYRSNRIDRYHLDSSILDPDYDYKYPKHAEHDSREFKRGNRDFERPYGWSKKALKVLGKYEDNEWLGVGRQSITDDAENEWPVSYHGTRREFADDIANKGYDISCGKRFRYGRGIYSTPSPELAGEYAHVFKYKRKNYKMIIMNRVNPASTREVGVDGIGTYFVTSEDNDVRPYAFLFKKA